MLSLLFIPLGFVIDQITKEKAVSQLKANSDILICNGKVKLNLVYNKGAFLGLLQKYPKLLLLINGFSAVVVGAALVISMFSKGSGMLKVGLSLMSAGAMGNIYDRLKRKKVVDFFSFQFKPFKPNVYFNIADFFVFIGAFLIFISRLIRK